MAVKQVVVCDGCRAVLPGPDDFGRVGVTVARQRQIAEDDATETIDVDLCVRCLAQVVRQVSQLKGESARKMLEGFALAQRIQ